MSANAATFHNSAAAEQAAYVQAVSVALEDFLEGKRTLLEQVSPDTVVLLESIKELVAGGKRMRALLCYWGYRGAGGARDSAEIIAAGAALELFQSAALIHDDIIDGSDSRRGRPSVHRQFGTLHANNGWALDRDRFGEAAAILTGDLCLSFSEELFASISIASVSRARLVFNLMRAEVMAGQYLDILEEVSGPTKPHSTAVQRAASIIRFKSAKYSSEHPLVLGGALGEAGEDLLAGYSDFALPLGEAFQLRDDVLGVFGDPAKTGKPAGDDLREGKRTVLVGFTVEAATEEDVDFLDSHLGRQDLSDAQIERMRHIMVSSRALAQTEEMIATLSSTAFLALAALEISENVKSALSKLGTAAVTRSA